MSNKEVPPSPKCNKLHSLTLFTTDVRVSPDKVKRSTHGLLGTISETLKHGCGQLSQMCLHSTLVWLQQFRAKDRKTLEVTHRNSWTCHDVMTMANFQIVAICCELLC